MDLGSLELQIFVSLTVVLGGAFVALVCDYLKGNNEQLREYNIELRVRKEEQERRLLLDPAGEMRHMQQTLGVTPTVAAAPQPQAKPAAPHEVMQSFADPRALADAEARAARLQARFDDDELEAADIPPLTQRRPKQRGGTSGKRKERNRGEEYSSWVRPEVLARVARRAEASAAYSSDIREEVEAVREREEALPKPLNPPDNWDIREELPARAKAEPPAEPVKPEPVNAEAAPKPPILSEPEKVRLQQEIERVGQLQRQPAAPAPGTILRPLTVPALRLEEELQRVVAETAEEKKQEEPAPAAWSSPLLEEVIAASTAPAVVPDEPAPMIEPAPTIEIELAPEVPPVILEPAFAVEPAATIEVEPQPEPEEIPAAVAAAILSEYSLSAAASRLSGMGCSTDLDFLATAPDLLKPQSGLALAALPESEPEPALEIEAETPAAPELPAFAPEPIPDFLPAFADTHWEPEVLSVEPPPVWEAEPVSAPAMAAELIDISVARMPEPEIPVVPAVPSVPDLLVPAGMHDAATWNRLLTLPNPLTGILFVIELRANEAATAVAEPIPDQAETIEKLMTSFVREGDFGSRIGENEWVFIYSHDAAGFNQRRIGMIPEKLWDFQLRHLGMANLTFKWGAVDVKSEPLGASLEAARARMNQTRRGRKLPGADVMAGRRVVNG